MRGIFIAAAIVLTAGSQVVIAVEVGQVVAVVERAEVRSGDQVVGSVDVGNVLTVGRVGDEGLWVNFKAAGWIDSDRVVPISMAEKVFGDRIVRDAEDAEAYFGRGRVRSAREDWKGAAADLDRAVELESDRPAFYLTRAYVRTRQRRYDDAFADYAEAIRLDPLEAQAYRLRAGIYVEQEDYARAVADYNLAARLFPNDAALNNDRAWLAATCPDETFRNGPQAVQDATLACELSNWSVFNRLGTLAAAYAETGNFAEAVKWQSKCVELSPERYRRAQQARLRLYEAGKPYREFPGVWK